MNSLFKRIIVKSTSATLFSAALISAALAGIVQYDFSYSGTGLNATGVLTVSDTLDSAGGYDILGITGVRNGEAITGLIGTAGFRQQDKVMNIAYDNILFTSGFSFDRSGLYFSTVSGGSYNVFSHSNVTDPIQGYLEVGGLAASSVERSIAVSISPSAVPEPASTSLLGLGLLGMMGVARRRKTVEA